MQKENKNHKSVIRGFKVQITPQPDRAPADRGTSWQGHAVRAPTFSKRRADGSTPHQPRSQQHSAPSSTCHGDEPDQRGGEQRHNSGPTTEKQHIQLVLAGCRHRSTTHWQTPAAHRHLTSSHRHIPAAYQHKLATRRHTPRAGTHSPHAGTHHMSVYSTRRHIFAACRPRPADTQPLLASSRPQLRGPLVIVRSRWVHRPSRQRHRPNPLSHGSSNAGRQRHHPDHRHPIDGACASLRLRSEAAGSRSRGA